MENRTLEILDQLQILIRKELENHSLILLMTSKAADFDEWTSLTHMRIINAIENFYTIRFAFQEIINFETIADIIETIVRHKPNT